MYYGLMSTNQLLILCSNQFVNSEDCLQTSQDLQKHSNTSDGNEPTLGTSGRASDESDDDNMDSLSAEPSTVVLKPLRKMRRLITLKWVPSRSIIQL